MKDEVFPTNLLVFQQRKYRNSLAVEASTLDLELFSHLKVPSAIDLQQ